MLNKQLTLEGYLSALINRFVSNRLKHLLDFLKGKYQRQVKMIVRGWCPN